MALTNSRPLQIPTMENEMLHNSTSPIFQLSALNLNANARNLAANSNIITSFPGSETVDLLDVNPAMNPIATGNQATPTKNRNNSSADDTSSNSGKSSNSTKTKKDSVSSKKENPLLEVSKLIPVTGERPAPEDRTPPLNDDVLFAVFVILWESDVKQNGLTVKQLCDILLAKHPEMSNLSTKLSNLISAKLNAYVKKIEKGEKTMKYAISREWSNSSPRRMLYIYRGILTADYKEHAKKVTDQLKQQMAEENEAKQESQMGESSFFNGNTVNSSPNNLTIDNVMNKGNINLSTNTGFTLSPGFNIPYSSSPVSVTLNQNTPNKPAITSSDNNKKKTTKQKSNDLTNKQTDTNDTRKRSNDNMKNENGSNSNNVVVNSKNLTTPQNKKQKMNNNNRNVESTVNSSRSTTMTPTLLDGVSNGNNTTTTPANSTGVSASSHKQSSYITAVAAAPRISKLLPKSGIRSNISNHIPHNGNNSLVTMFHQTPCSPKMESESISEDGMSEDNAWLKIVREGFLTKDIQSPESISLDELDSII
ncbi:similar to Saccharomyces cerevisiae YOR355W GDS1 Protein of unknown function, required for growth on glycerol as a carbon source [Maudiozyma barnettii]|mgnify:CR=1 FL=1|uniref:GDS1 winged helix domain-containing protein n=1 Tax=Maudiozyma barnettii TaxID=61262 RepID=A0A8H2VG72_9SACH|nr:Gds1p [Kazachstania barnettii]CAB4254841.1 similar to Saccharomyces cerevisiae YOR355W GDS1 Protein of unknown function, required for growth on glycerol as a carbon source [Kazachstania barnettii]CAD1783043.1 similar to Saccharomyces cerevisiae YOR355W GDS1 Protein of unknown function, required for growth on glycerol as a carbon source [Kazachstania barnettii]